MLWTHAAVPARPGRRPSPRPGWCCPRPRSDHHRCGARGVYARDRRVLSLFEVLVDGRRPEPLSSGEPASGRADFTAVLDWLGAEPPRPDGDAAPASYRRAPTGLVERGHARQPLGSAGAVRAGRCSSAPTSPVRRRCAAGRRRELRRTGRAVDGRAGLVGRRGSRRPRGSNPNRCTGTVTPRLGMRGAGPGYDVGLGAGHVRGRRQRLPDRAAGGPGGPFGRGRSSSATTRGWTAGCSGRWPTSPG